MCTWIWGGAAISVWLVMPGEMNSWEARTSKSSFTFAPRVKSVLFVEAVISLGLTAARAKLGLSARMTVREEAACAYAEPVPQWRRLIRLACCSTYKPTALHLREPQAKSLLFLIVMLRDVRRLSIGKARRRRRYDQVVMPVVFSTNCAITLLSDWSTCANVARSSNSIVRLDNSFVMAPEEDRSLLTRKYSIPPQSPLIAVDRGSGSLSAIFGEPERGSIC